LNQSRKVVRTTRSRQRPHVIEAEIWRDLMDPPGQVSVCGARKLHGLWTVVSAEVRASGTFLRPLESCCPATLSAGRAAKTVSLISSAHFTRRTRKTPWASMIVTHDASYHSRAAAVKGRHVAYVDRRGAFGHRRRYSPRWNNSSDDPRPASRNGSSATAANLENGLA
jgi:hypothetical protein